MEFLEFVRQGGSLCTLHDPELRVGGHVTVTTLFARDVFTLLEKIGPVDAASWRSRRGTDSRFRFRATAGVGKRESGTTVYRGTGR